MFPITNSVYILVGQALIYVFTGKNLFKIILTHYFKIPFSFYNLINRTKHNI